MMKRVIGGLVVGAVLLGGIALAQGGVQLPPAEEEIAAMETAFNQVSQFFAGLITELKGAVSALNAVDADLAARYRAVATQLKDAEARIRELQGTCAELGAIAETLAKTDQELAAGITALAQSLEKTRQDFVSAITTLGDKVSDLTKQAAAHGNRIAALEAYDIALKAEIEALGAKLDEQVLALQGSIAGINRQLSDHAGRIAALEAQDIGSMQRRILALEQSVQTLNIKIENNREKIVWLEKAVGGFTANLQTTIGTLQVQVDDHEARLVTVETTVAGLDVKVLQDGIAMAQGIAIVALLAGLAALVMALLGGS